MCNYDAMVDTPGQETILNPGSQFSDVHQRTLNQQSVSATRNTPEMRLSRLMSRELDVTVDPRLLRLFLKHHWSKVSALAHEIHEEE